MKVDEQTVTTTELEEVETNITTITEVSETSADITSDIISAEITEENTTNVIPSETIVETYNYTPANGEISYETVISEEAYMTDENGVIWEQETTETTAESEPETITETITETKVTNSKVSNMTEQTETITYPETIAQVAETSAVIESITTDVETVDSADLNELSQYVEPGKLGVFGVMAMAIAAAIAAKSKAKRKNDDGDSARDRDRRRLEAKKPKKKVKDKRRAEFKEKKKRSKTVLDTIPYVKVLDDNIFYLGNKKYSKAYTFDDINFNMADEEQQYMALERYIEFLNTLDDTVDCQICLWNSRLDMNEFRERTLIQQHADDLFDLRHEYNTRVLEENIKKGQNAIQKHMYVTMTVKAPDEESAQRRFKSLDLATCTSFNRIGNTNMRVLTSQERIEMLRGFFIGNNGYYVTAFTEEMYRRGEEKLYCAPDYFEFKKDYFMFGEFYAKAVYIRDFPATATSEIITSLLAAGIEVLITTNIETYDMAEARKLVQHQITAIDTDMSKREVAAAQHGNFSNQTPQRIKNQRDSMVAVFDKITTKDQKLFLANVQLIVKANSYEELENNVEALSSILKRTGCIMGQMPWEQEDGLWDCLPCGYQKKFLWQRAMPSEAIAILIPFNVKEMQMKNATYYGLNVLSNNIIIFDRLTGLINPAGFVLACPGSGKSFFVKKELLAVFLRYNNVDVVIIDPEREYWKLVEALGGTVVRFANGSKNHINPFDFDFKLLEDDEVDIIADKCQLLTSFISCMDQKHPLNAQEKSFVDRCVRKAYLKSGVLDTLDENDMPTLGTFLDVMKAETENINKDMKDKLIVTIDMYVNGSAKYFNNQTNVDTNNRLISYDIRDLNGNLKTQSMLLILDYIWNRMSKNRDLGRATYIYFDEAHLLFNDEYCLEFLRMLWKRARKYGGILTGITQNVEDLLKDDKSRSMLANSEFLVLLKQNPTDAAKLQDVLHFTDSEIQYVNDTPPGHGILVLGGKDKIPFYDEFPKDTKLYEYLTTAFSETANMMNDDKKD
ncbi:MAG: DUF87 domain-containing protein [Oscillospiraceae bacterium]|nr:DUF87 domain-containing protein [Oscillospiraceae bacterium]